MRPVKEFLRQEAWRSRAALASVVTVCVVATTLAVTGAGADTNGMKFLQTGHLIYNSTLRTVFHIDGGTKAVDGQLPVPELGSGVQTVQTDKHGYMLARGSITEFGKSDLKVEDPVKAPSEERPTALEAAGAAYAVYRNAGAIARLSEDPVTLPGSGSLGPPVTTADGTLWVHRLTSRELCRLPIKADRLTCTAEVPSGHTGALTVVSDRVVFVDTTARELRAVDSDGFGRKVPVPEVAMTPASMVAPYDVDGRIAIVDPTSNELQLVDAAPVVGDQQAAAPVVQKLPAGKYSQIASSGHGLALIYSTNDTLVTLGADGKEKSVRRIPPANKAKPDQKHEPTLFRGADKRLYVDSVAGEHSMVVDDDGEVTEVEAVGPARKPEKSRPKETITPSTPPRTEETQKPPLPKNTEGSDGDKRTPRRTEPPRTEKPQRKTTPPPSKPTPTKPTTTKPTPPPVKPTKPKPKPPPVKASPAAAPPGLKATPGDNAVTLTWRRPNLNGGTFVSYSVSQDSDPETTTSPSYTWDGLKNGTAYTFEVRAVTRGSDGEMLIGVAATVTATPGSGTFSITYGPQVTKFTDSNCPEGTEQDCHYMVLHARGFEPNTDYTFRAYSNGTQIHDPYTLSTDDNGDLDQEKFHNSRVGETVYVTVTGPGGPYKSNSFKWPAG
ncbi:fibronectin type III domain-containing protein [Kribbella sp. C-35]|uniref:fibronectin type III domain-containing protein n=1 Tax=Kribbella sp. C-35 TaxID=2789276 RepID=UPI003979001D